MMRRGVMCSESLSSLGTITVRIKRTTLRKWLMPGTVFFTPYIELEKSKKQML